MKKKQITTFIIIILLIVGVIVFLSNRKAAAPQNTGTKKSTSAAVNQNVVSPAVPAGFNKTLFSNSDPTSLWVVVNKTRPLEPKTYVPDDLVIPNIPLRSNITNDEKHVRAAVGTALETMATAAKQEGVTLNLQSGYRSYTLQVSVYNNEVKNYGQAKADQESARPGYSEHQSGLAADLGGISNPSCNVADCFANTVEGKWLAANAYKYGFLIRYPADKQPVTGYRYEPWHVRFIGTSLSTELHDQNISTLEEFFGLPAAPNY